MIGLNHILKHHLNQVRFEGNLMLCHLKVTIKQLLVYFSYLLLFFLHLASEVYLYFTFKSVAVRECLRAFGLTVVQIIVFHMIQWKKVVAFSH